jgi:ribose transport system ATP-binding protein
MTATTPSDDQVRMNQPAGSSQAQRSGEPPVVRLKGLTKRFAGVVALDGVDLEVRRGEVHGLLGENGSGKSTLIKTLAGYHDVDGGTLEVSGKPVSLPLPPGRFRDLGMDFVYQDLGLIEGVSVLENLRLREILESGARINWKEQRRRALEIFERYGLDLDPNAKIEEIRPVQRAQLAIIRAVEGMREGIAQNGLVGGLLVLDEPTVFLPRREVEQLFALVREIAAGGSSVLFVSHDLDEIKEITDRVTVLRDGRLVGTVDTRATSKDDIVKMIVGRALSELEDGPHNRPREGVAASVRDLTGGAVKDVTFDVHEGEILGLTGLLGSGFEDVLYLLYGAEPAESGQLTLRGRTLDVTAMSPRRAIDNRITLIPADRQREGSIGSLSVADNLTAPLLDDYFVGGRLRRRRLHDRAREVIEKFDVRPRDPTLPYSALSGGNQQKVLLAKWLEIKPQLMLLHEPTQGVDIGARHQILATLQDATATGMSVICASSDYEQLAQFCNRVLIFGRGRLVRELIGDEVTKDRIVEQCYASAGGNGFTNKVNGG